MGKIFDWLTVKASQAALPRSNDRPKPKHKPKKGK